MAPENAVGQPTRVAGVAPENAALLAEYAGHPGRPQGAGTDRGPRPLSRKGPGPGTRYPPLIGRKSHGGATGPVVRPRESSFCRQLRDTQCA